MAGAAVGMALFSGFVLPIPVFAIAGNEFGGAVIPLALALGHMSAPYVAIMCLLLAGSTLLGHWDDSDETPPGRFWKFTCAPAGIVVTSAVAVGLTAPTMTLSGLLVRPGNGAVIMLVTVACMRALGVRNLVVLWGSGLMGLLMGIALPATAWWFAPVAITLGMWIRWLGDALTEHPPRRLRRRLPLSERAGVRLNRGADRPHEPVRDDRRHSNGGVRMGVTTIDAHLTDTGLVLEDRVKTVRRVCKDYISPSSAHTLAGGCAASWAADRLGPRNADPMSPANTGTIVHAVMEALYGLPAERRTPEAAMNLWTDCQTQARIRAAEAGLVFTDSQWHEHFAHYDAAVLAVFRRVLHRHSSFRHRCGRH